MKAVKLQLVSHHLCPYVQRAVIVAAEKGVALGRTLIDLSDKPGWFVALSPTGKVPLLRVTGADGTEHVLFESAAISEFLDETGPPPALMPACPLARARQRAWVEFASGTLADIAGLYGAPDATGYEAKAAALRRRFLQVEMALEGPWFAGGRFGLVDAAFAPVFRYLDAFERLVGLQLVEDLPKLAAWRAELAARPSVAGAVATDYVDRLTAFLRACASHLGRLARDAEVSGKDWLKR